MAKLSVLQEFKKFALRGNLVDMAVGFTVGAAFSTVAKSVVSDILMPPLGLLLGSADFSDLFIVLKEGSKAAAPYATLAGAQASGAVTLNYGLFLNNVVAFILVAIAMFFIIRLMNRAEEALEERFGDKPEAGEPTEKKCEFCRSTIPFKASRCPFCTSELGSQTEAPAAKSDKT